jgi:hypothetical protein
VFVSSTASSITLDTGVDFLIGLETGGCASEVFCKSNI